MSRRKLSSPVYRLRQHRNGRWYIDWTDAESGHSRSVSTGQVERAAAEKWRDQWIAGRNQPTPPSQATIAEIMQAYTIARLPHVENKSTMLYISRTISRLLGNLEPHMLARSSYFSLRSNGISDGTIRREVIVLRAALHWAQREGWIETAPYVEMPPKPPPRDRWLTREEVQKLIDAALSAHVRLFVILAYHTAARGGAILDLTWDRVDFERRLIVYDRADRRQSKKRRATVPINTPAFDALREAYPLRTTDYVIEYNREKIGTIKHAFIRLCARAGVEDCSPHVLRHTAASHMVMAGVPLREVARMLGATEATVERVYGKHSPDFLRNAADALANGKLLKFGINRGRE